MADTWRQFSGQLERAMSERPRVARILRKRYRRETDTPAKPGGCDDKGPDTQNPCCCHGFQRAVQFNGAENFRHFAAAVYYGPLPAIGHTTYSDWTEARWHEYVSGNRERARENRAENRGTWRAAIAARDLRNTYTWRMHAMGARRTARRREEEGLGPFASMVPPAPWAGMTDEEYVWSTMRALPGRYWRRDFCKGQ